MSIKNKEKTKMKSIALIIPYFGKLPNYFELFLNSAMKNTTIDFYFFIDDEIKFKYASNIHVIKLSFKEMKEKAQKCFDFKISLNAYYKICDYKPAYGQIFYDYIEKYDFWGYCDIDIILGDIRAFITDEILCNYKRVLTNGHLSIYKNDPTVNRWYCTLTSQGCQNYRDVYMSTENCSYDEWAAHAGNGISEIIKRNNIAQFGQEIREIFHADLNILTYSFVFKNRWGTFVKKDKVFFHYKNNKLYLLCIKNGESFKQEILYVHFQKRKIDIDGNCNLNNYYFVPPGKVINEFGGVPHISDGFYFFKYKWLFQRLILKIKGIKGYKKRG